MYNEVNRRYKINKQLKAEPSVRRTDWRVEIVLLATSHDSNAIALAYTARAVLILGGTTYAPITVVSGLKFKFFFIQRRRSCCGSLFPIFDISIRYRDNRNRRISCLKLRQILHVFCPTKFLGCTPPKKLYRYHNFYSCLAAHHVDKCSWK